MFEEVLFTEKEDELHKEEKEEEKETEGKMNEREEGDGG